MVVFEAPLKLVSDVAAHAGDDALGGGEGHLECVGLTVTNVEHRYCQNHRSPKKKEGQRTTHPLHHIVHTFVQLHERL